MKKLFSFFITLLFIIIVRAQNVGIGTPAPVEKLDVSGNVNITGTIKANGVAGTNGQVLKTNNSGVLEWANISDFKNFENFSSIGAGSWTVPANITRILIEAWAGGGGGSGFGGGGGGGYITAYFTVVPGNSVSFNIGDNGGPGNSGSALATDGKPTTATVGAVTITASGGLGSKVYDATPPVGIYAATGGAYSVSPASFLNYMGLPGKDGEPNHLIYQQSSATTYLEVTMGGTGGNAGNQQQSGGNGCYTLYNVSTTTMVRYTAPAVGKKPGGGGGGNYTSSGYYGTSGGDGKIIIHY
jgi:hypothetical protein